MLVKARCFKLSDQDSKPRVIGVCVGDVSVSTRHLDALCQAYLTLELNKVFIHPLTHSVALSHTHSLTHSLTHSQLKTYGTPHL